ncbi:MAG: ABC transporter permease [Candidatus Omnitrophota bacterium]
MNSALMVMWQRQIKEYFRNKQRMIGTLAQPLLFLVTFGFGLSSTFKQTGNGSYIQYLTPGIVGMTILFSAVMNGMSLIWDKQFGFLKETLVAPVSRARLLFGRCLGGATTSIFQGLIVIIFAFLMGFRISDWALFPLAVILMFLTALLFSLLGTSLASKFDDMQSFPTIMNLLVMPMFFLSGALFPIKNFPSVIRILAKINPMTYCVDLLKYAFGGKAEFNIVLNITVLAMGIIALGILGTYFFNRLET